VYVGGYLTG